MEMATLYFSARRRCFRYLLSDKETSGKKCEKVEKQTKWAPGEGVMQTESTHMGEKISEEELGHHD